MNEIIYEEVIPGGAMWSMRIPRHRVLKLSALDAGANVSALFFNAENPLDRLNLPDTLKALHTAKLTRGHIIMSDMGHAMVSITEDSLGWHDPLGGHASAAHIQAAFGQKNYQIARNDFYRNAHDGFLVELSKHGLDLADLVANVNFFSKVASDDSGRLRLIHEHCFAGASISLRTELHVLAVFANCPHPMHDAGAYPRTRVKIEILRGEPPMLDDYCKNFRPECARALALSDRLFI